MNKRFLNLTKFFKYEKRKAVVEKILIINSITKLCDDVLNIIKDYLFYYSEDMMQIILKKELLNNIEFIDKGYHKQILRSNFIIFGNKINIRSYMINIWDDRRIFDKETNLDIEICSKCGDYIDCLSFTNALCRCNHNMMEEIIESYENDNDLINDECSFVVTN